MYKTILTFVILIAWWTCNKSHAQHISIKDGQYIGKDLSVLKNFFGSVSIPKGISFEIQRVVEGNSSMHFHLTQLYKGIEIVDSKVVVHTSDDRVTSVTGRIIDNISTDFVPRLTATEAQEKALEFIKFEEIKKQGIPLADCKVILDPLIPTKLELGFSNLAGDTQTDRKDLVYVVSLNPVFPFDDNFVVFIDTRNSEPVAYKSARVCSTPGQVTTLSYGLRVVDTEWSGSLNKYRLIDNSRGNGIQTRRCDPQFLSFCNPFVNDSDNDWDDDFEKRIHASTQWGAQVVWDYFDDVLSRSGPDASSKGLDIITDYQGTISNACAPSTNPMRMTFAAPNGNTCNARISLNAIGHEFTHGVLHTDGGISGNLGTGSEVYAIMEAYCDIFGEFVEFDFEGNVDWEYDAESWIDVTEKRAFHPPIFNGVDAMFFNDANWTSNSDGHHRGGILRHWAFMLSEGSSGTNPVTSSAFCVKSIGIKNVEKILYDVLNQGFLSSTSTFNNLRTETLNMAATIFGANSYEVAQVQSAWFAVGIGTNFSGSIEISNRTINPPAFAFECQSAVEMENISLSGSANATVASATSILLSPDVTIPNGSEFFATIQPACAGAARYANPSVGSIPEKLNIADNQAFDEDRFRHKQLEAASFGFTISPNPAQDELEIMLSDRTVLPESAEIVNGLGIRVISITSEPDHMRIDINSLSPGIYFVRLSHKSEIQVRKLIKL